MIAGAVFFNAGVGVALFLLLVAADVIVDAVATASAAQRLEESADATFLDAMPHRMPVMQRRWDPLYRTRHQVVTLIDDGVTINRSGIAFDGVAVLGKEPTAIPDAVIKDEDRDANGEVATLRYRVADLTEIAGDLAEVAPGPDRRPFLPADAARPTLVGVTLDQVNDRIGSERLVHPIALAAMMIELVDNHIGLMLLISRREIDEERGRLIDRLRQDTEDDLRADLTDIETEETERLRTELGREPTVEELTEAVGARVKKLVDDAQLDYEETAFPGDLQAAISGILSFDLAPHELAELQDAGVLVVEGKEIIRMRSGTVYYRDHPDFNAADNLLSLPHYHAPYVPT